MLSRHASVLVGIAFGSVSRVGNIDDLRRVVFFNFTSYEGIAVTAVL